MAEFFLVKSSIEKETDTGTDKLMERFSELIKYISDAPKSKTFAYYTKISAPTWFNNKIIPGFTTSSLTTF